MHCIRNIYDFESTEHQINVHLPPLPIFPLILYQQNIAQCIVGRSKGRQADNQVNTTHIYLGFGVSKMRFAGYGFDLNRNSKCEVEIILYTQRFNGLEDFASLKIAIECSKGLVKAKPSGCDNN